MRGPQPWKTHRARALRNRGTSAEEVLWEHLRNRQIGGFKFVRQMAAGEFFVDFVCRAARLIVEVDGSTHSTAGEITRDKDREAALRALGYDVWRVGNGEVFDNIDGVLESLLTELRRRASRSSSL